MSALAGIVTPDGVDTGKLLEPAIQLVAALSSDVAAAVEFTAGGGVLGLLAILSDTTHTVSVQCLGATSTATSSFSYVHMSMEYSQAVCMAILLMLACRGKASHPNECAAHALNPVHTSA